MKTKTQIIKQILSIFLCFAMLFTMLPSFTFTVFAADGDACTVSISAVDAENGAALVGAQFLILDTYSVVVDDWTFITDVHMITGLKANVEYTLCAIEAPEGYKLPSDVTFTIDADGNVTPAGTIVNGVLSVRFEKVKKYPVTFHAGEGAFADGSKEITIDVEFDTVPIAPETPERAGYSFKGWTPELAPVGVNGATYTADYAPGIVEYKVEFFTMDTTGAYGAPESETKYAEVDSTVSVTPEDKEGFSVDTVTSVLEGTVAANGSTVLEVYYMRNQYNLTTVIDGVEETKPYYYEKTIEKPADPTKSGYIFTGWDIEIPDTMPANDLTVTAEFSLCDHSGSQHETVTDNGDTHSFICTVCGTTVTKPHTKTYSVNKAGDTIIASCSANCGHTETATISITGKTYDGTAVEASVSYSDNWSVDRDLAITYAVKGGATLTEAPKNAGAYTTSVTYENLTASAEYTIEKATPTAEDFVYIAPTDLVYDDTDKAATVTVKDGIVGMGELNVIYFRYSLGSWFDNQRAPHYPGKYKVGIWLDEGENYDAIYSNDRIWLGNEFEITYLTTDATAVISGTQGSNGWYTSDVTLSAPEGYQISKTHYSKDFCAALTVSDEQNETFTYYLKNTASGEVAEKTVALKIDKTAPVAEYKIETDGWKQFINTITFGLFCKDYKTVEINYSDNLSGVAAKQYYIADAEVTDTSGIAWSDYANTLSLNATGRYFVYVRVVDNAGHEVILNTEGIAIYEDSVQVTENVSATYKACTDQDVTVELNGNTVNAIKNGDDALTADTDYSVSEGKITLKADYLNTLNAGTYTFTVSYNPLGETYVEAEGSDVPATTAFTLSVAPESIENATVTLSDNAFIYDASEKTPNIEVKLNGITLTKETDYTVSYSDNVNAGIATVTVEGLGNYDGTVTKTFIINTKPITVTIQNATSIYGEALAELKATDNGIVNGDTNVYSLATTATSDVGKYAITGTALDSNYAITFVNGEYEITKREITITVEAKNTIVNTALPIYTYKVEGLLGEDKLVTEPTLTSNADITVIGEYDITANGADAGGNYSIKYVPAKLTVLTDNAVDAAAGYTEELKDYDPATVTSEDKTELDEILKEINTILDDENITDNGKKALEEVKEQVEKLIKEITDAADATDTENTEKVKDVTTENVTPEDKTDLEKAKADLEKALEDHGSNMTEDEKKAVEDEIKRIDDALEVIGNVEEAEELIDKLPAVDTVEPDDEEAIKAITNAQTVYNALSDYEKSLVDEDTKAALDKLAAAIVAYDIVEGDGSSWTEDSDHSITFVVNGLFSKFVGIKVDGKDVDKANYEAKAGSTIITLKASYLDALKVGEHTITVIYADGETEGTFNVHAKANSPATGDDFNIALYGSLMVVSVTALVVLLLISKKKKYAK